MEKVKKKIETKYRWETLDVIPLFQFVGVNHCQPILHMSKIMVQIYSTDERVNKFVPLFWTYVIYVDNDLPLPM